MQISYRVTEHDGDKYHFCSDACMEIFEFEPEKYVQAWLPVHQIYQGNCGGPTIPDVLDWYKFKPEDVGDYIGSKDHQRWEEWKGSSQTSQQVENK